MPSVFSYFAMSGLILEPDMLFNLCFNSHFNCDSLLKSKSKNIVLIVLTSSSLIDVGVVMIKTEIFINIRKETVTL